MSLPMSNHGIGSAELTLSGRGVGEGSRLVPRILFRVASVAGPIHPVQQTPEKKDISALSVCWTCCIMSVDKDKCSS